MRIISFVLLIIIVLSGCNVRLGPRTGTGAEATETEEELSKPYVKTSFEYSADDPIHAKRAAATAKITASRVLGNSVKIGDFTYSVVELAHGFGVLKLDNTMSTVDQVTFSNTDPNIRSLSSPRISDIGSTSFMITMKATTENGSEDVRFTVNVPRLTVSRS